MFYIMWGGASHPYTEMGEGYVQVNALPWIINSSESYYVLMQTLKINCWDNPSRRGYDDNYYIIDP